MHIMYARFYNLNGCAFRPHMNEQIDALSYYIGQVYEWITDIQA